MFPLVLLGAAAFAVTFYLSRRKPSSAMSPASPTPGSATLTAKPGNPATAARIRALAELLQKVAPDVIGRPLSPAALEVALAQAAAEMTGYGQGWDGDMKGSFNVASYQCGGAQKDTSYYRCVVHQDSRPQADGTQKTYTTGFRYYIDGATPDGKARPAPEAAAWDFLTSVTSPKRFDLGKELDSGDVLAYALGGYRHHYFEGFNLSAEGQAAYRATIDRLVQAGVSTKGTETAPQVAGRIALYAGSMGRALPEIAAALGHDRVYATAPADVMTFRPAFVASTKGPAVA
jgi:hypothetical protein